MTWLDDPLTDQSHVDEWSKTARGLFDQFDLTLDRKAGWWWRRLWHRIDTFWRKLWIGWKLSD